MFAILKNIFKRSERKPIYKVDYNIFMIGSTKYIFSNVKHTTVVKYFLWYCYKHNNLKMYSHFDTSLYSYLELLFNTYIQNFLDASKAFAFIETNLDSKITIYYTKECSYYYCILEINNEFINCGIMYKEPLS